MPKHPSAQNPLMAPILLKAKTTVLTVAHKALMFDPLTFLTSSLTTLTFTSRAPDTMM